MSNIEPKRQNPITIRLSSEHNYILADEYNTENISIDKKDIIFNGFHYGIDIITDDDKKYHYATQSNIEEAKIEDGYLIIYEEGKSIPWRINFSGMVLVRAKFDETKTKDLQYIKRVLSLKRKDIAKLNDYEAFIEKEEDYIIKPQINNYIAILLNDDNLLKLPLSFLKPTIIVEKSKPAIALEKSAIIDGEHYGFKVISAKKSITLPTQCPIQSITLENAYINIYEQGKCHPWNLTRDLTVKHYAYFEDHKPSDIAYLNDNFGLGKENIEKINAYGLKYVNKA